MNLDKNDFSEDVGVRDITFKSHKDSNGSELIKKIDIVFDKAFYNVSNLCESLHISFSELFLIQEQINKLHLSGSFTEKITFSDLDDTLISRLPQLTEDKFAKNRGEAGNHVLYNMGMANFCSKYCKPYMLIKPIANTVDVLLSAGKIDIQESKLNSLSLNLDKIIVVDKHNLKPVTILTYILFELEAIPENIVFYDDRMKELLESFKYISDLLGNKFTLHEVELSETNPDKIKNIETVEYHAGEEHIPLKKSLDVLMIY